MNRWRPRRLARMALLIVPLTLGWGAPARAEDPPPFREPGITYIEERGPYLEWSFGALIVVACLLIAFKNPHRTHMD